MSAFAFPGPDARQRPGRRRAEAVIEHLTDLIVAGSIGPDPLASLGGGPRGAHR